MSFAAVQKHVAVLEAAGLVTKRRAGGSSSCSGNVHADPRRGELLDEFEELWRGRIDRIDDLLTD